MATSKWTANDMPNQTGRVAIVTGANIGLGYESALALARQGAQVVMASRDQAKGQKALTNLKAAVPGAKAELMRLDLADLASVRAFAGEFKARYDRLDLLLNNAGVMAIPRRETADGFEMQFGTNHLGHFALTGLLLDLLLKTPDSRVVNVSSSAQYMGRMNFEDPQLRQNYSRWGAYGQSKLANVLFTHELQRRLEQAGSTTISASAHPGGARTNLQATSVNASGNRIERTLDAIFSPLLMQSAAMGALPQLYAATAPDVKGGEFFGPRFFMRGYPVRAKAARRSFSEADARRLWNLSEELTGVHYNFEKQGASLSKIAG
jgi:NAD(P)-dependent dehydrogenase (short-subunit alcohol dehydrogenase family)